MVRQSSPLRARHLRELRSDLGKYLVIFVLLVITIGFISGFLVADGSMLKAYNDSFEKYNMEDGNFRTQKKMNRAQRKALEKLGITVFDNFYADTALDNGSTLRFFQNRETVNTVCLMEGRLPEAAGEVAIDRAYAKNNGLVVGDTLRRETGDGESAGASGSTGTGSREWTITGLVALPDYSTMFSDNNDTMFDAIKFGVGVVTAEEFALFEDKDLQWCYVWKYTDPPADEKEAQDRAEDLARDMMREVKLESFIPLHQNQAVQFTGEDMGSDKAMMEVLFYIMIAIIAFVFTVTISNTISREAAVIGTLRAMGFTRGELIRHYMCLPVAVTLVSALIGNLLGYTWFKELCVDMYYNSYSLPTYVTIWNAEAFLKTTLVPILMMAAITFAVLRYRLALSPLKFLRRDLKKHRSRRAFPLSERIPFLNRFRMRVILQNIPNYAILAIGIAFANLLLLFGVGLPDVLDRYEASVQESLLAKYQYILQVPMEVMDDEHKLESFLNMAQFARAVETENETAEKISVYSLRTPSDSPYKKEDIMLYGMKTGSRYVGVPEDGTVLVSRAYADKYDVTPGSEIVLQEKYGGDRYTFAVSGIYEYESALCVFMEQKMLNRTFDFDEDYFAGYMADEPITDIDPKYIGTVIDYDSLTKVSRQLDLSMGSMMYMVDGFSVIIFIVLIYLLSKVIIEKNAQSISMTKILGYTGGEISGLYLRSTTLVTLLCMVLTLPLDYAVLKYLMKIMIRMEMTGWISLVIGRIVYVKILALGAASYAVVAALEYRKILSVPMDEALKNVE